ncbi:Nitrogen regulatory protein PII [Rubrobacter radiotolerans]|uniref:Nitrogen regulatory protein PII n=1 Tax=Rubrobacter radiotolerans TaxID=42256 RepID=A0A023X5V2_RUBRA|nr:P-II family nitrogen regulator [Rubrobacter radiotolerans]AHY47444.1 Nitrogen regulatory protein PII [Rubrobacter radiotolerans]MDX5894847.1 P-II family nitrogen regulator [Rubrobacter radiotolerans]SMC06898.1 nitrogen regulatory protein P-II family [Rubrobacter radiotolerans DSM 5868]
MQGYKLIAAILPKGSTSKAMDAAREAGAEGGTILLARGTGVHEAKRFFGVSVSSERELLLILVEPSKRDAVLDAVVRAGRLNEPTRGIAFVLAVEEVTGIVHREE